MAAPPHAWPLRMVRSLGAFGLGVVARLMALFEAVGGVTLLFASTVRFLTQGVWQGRTKIRRQLFPLMANVGVRSFPIIALISFLMGAILVLNTGDILAAYGQKNQLPVMVTLSMAREMGPLMTAILLTARVGASYTAVLASMKINEEVMALETMGIHPHAYLVAPRLMSMAVMTPLLTVWANVIGALGGCVVAVGLFGLTPRFYFNSSLETLAATELFCGLIKAFFFSLIISMVCCHYGLRTEGGPMGLGRNTMIAVVTSIVAVIVADTLLTTIFLEWVW